MEVRSQHDPAPSLARVSTSIRDAATRVITPHQRHQSTRTRARLHLHAVDPPRGSKVVRCSGCSWGRLSGDQHMPRPHTLPRDGCHTHEPGEIESKRGAGRRRRMAGRTLEPPQVAAARAATLLAQPLVAWFMPCETVRLHTRCLVGCRGWAPLICKHIKNQSCCYHMTKDALPIATGQTNRGPALKLCLLVSPSAPP